MGQRKQSSLIFCAILTACSAAPTATTMSPEERVRISAAIDAAEGVLKSSCNSQNWSAANARHDIGDARWKLSLAAAGDWSVTPSIRKDLEDLTANVAECTRAATAINTQNERCHGDVHIGMRDYEVRRTAWCTPTKINTTETAGHIREQWVYRPEYYIPGLNQPQGILYFTDGSLTTIQR